MVPDKFNMIDMGGIDLIMTQGEEVPGLYNRLVESIAQCRYQCLYNWFFDGVVIPPSYVEMEVNEDDEVAINEGVTVSPDDVVHIYSIEPGPVDPEIIPLLAEENGTYTVPAGKDGFNPVTVDVPSYTPIIESLSITENGTYTVPTGKDGFNPVTVNVPATEPAPKLYWDLSESLVDQIIGATITLSGGASLTSDGVTLPNGASQIKIPYVKPCGIKLVLDVGDTSAVFTSYNLRFLVSNINGWDSGLIYRNTGEWSFFSGTTWDSGSGITDVNFFDNSIVTIDIDYTGLWKIYKDGVLVYAPSLPLLYLTYSMSVGSTNYSYFPALIKSIKVF